MEMINIEQEIMRIKKKVQSYQTGSMENKKETNYQCSKCKDTEWIIDKDTSTAARCECYEKKQYQRILKSSGLEEQIKSKTLESYNPNLLTNNAARKRAAENKEITTRFIENFVESEKGTSLFISGQVGSGKTHLTIAAANELMNQNIGVIYMRYREDTPRLKSLITDEFEYNKAIDRYKNARVLLIDDLFKGSISRTQQGRLYLNAADQRLMFEIIDYRYFKQLPMIISTEYNISHLIEVDEAIGTRIAEMARGNIATFKGKESNYRLYGRVCK